MSGERQAAARVGVIGGSGLEHFSALEQAGEETMTTPWGEPSAPPRVGRLSGVPVAFLPRHGERHDIPPHRVNYRANLWALQALGAHAVVGIGAVGAIAPWLTPGGLALPDQLIDYTWGRPQSFWDRAGEPMRHIEFTTPVDPPLHGVLEACGAQRPSPPLGRGVYAVTQGPRLETAAEVRRLQRDGCDMVGMTLMPEAALARELGLAYANIAFVANWAAGCGRAGLHDEAERFLVDGAQAATELLLHAMEAVAEGYA